MAGDTFTFMVGGKAGEGVKSAALVASAMFSAMGRSVFQNDDYMSLIKGGHNFSVVTSAAKRKVLSPHMGADLIVSLDQRSHDMHGAQVADGGIEVLNSDAVKANVGNGVGIPMTTEAKRYPRPDLRLGVGGVAILASAIGMDLQDLMAVLEREFPKDLENNKAYASTILALAKGAGIAGRFILEKGGGGRRPIITGNEAIALGMAAGGLDIYLAYPMTPASSILHFLASNDRELGITVFHPENEIAVANIAIGAAATGARSAVGTSAGGFALMEEALSLAGMTETPLLCILSMRPGPSTGVPTYSAQGDLMFALHQGHGDYPRLVASPGTVEEAYHLAAEMLDMVWRFQTPGILLTEKHLSEASMTVDIDTGKTAWPDPVMHSSETGVYKRYLDTKDGISPLLFPPSKELIKWNSYEHDEKGITSEKPGVISQMQEKRMRKEGAIIDRMKGMRTVNVFGRTGPVIFTYGSTTMSVLEALAVGGIEAKVVQPIYLRPLPVWELQKHEARGAIVVEQSAGGQFATLLSDKLGIKDIKPIRRYDGRPFEPTELAKAIKEAL